MGYNIDYNIINEYLPYNLIKQRSRERKQHTLDVLISKLEDIGIIVDEDKLNKRFSADVAVYYYLIQNIPDIKSKLPKELMDNVNSFFRKGVSNPKSDFYVDNSKFYLSPKEASDLIHKAGGKVFLAHAYLYAFDDIIKFIDELRNETVIDGLEVFHSSFSKEQSDSLITYCKKNNLYMSGGSDYHGEAKPLIKLKIGSNNLNIGNDILTWY